MAFHYQCGTRTCRKRYSFKKPLENYKRRPPGLTKDGRCGVCKKGFLNEVDKHVKKWNRSQETCNCGLIIGSRGTLMPHRKGTVLTIKGKRMVCESADWDSEYADQFGGKYGSD